WLVMLAVVAEQSLMCVFTHACPPHIVFLTLKKDSRLVNVPQRANMTWPRCPHHGGIKHVSPNPQEFCRELPLISQSKKSNGLQNSQSEKKRIFCIWVRFHPATNENKASWNCARLIFRKFRSPEETTGAPSISLLQRVSRLLFKCYNKFTMV